MSAVSLAHPPRIQASVPARRAAVLLHLARFAHAVSAAIRREIRLRRDMRRLAQFDDCMLHDLGITRVDIDKVVRDGRDPRF